MLSKCKSHSVKMNGIQDSQYCPPYPKTSSIGFCLVSLINTYCIMILVIPELRYKGEKGPTDINEMLLLKH